MLVKDSEIHGKGCFAEKDFKAKEIIDMTVLPKLEYPLDNEMEYFDDEGKYFDLRQSNWRFLNHQHDNNAEWYSGNTMTLIAEKDIKEGEEITINYRQDFFN